MPAAYVLGILSESNSTEETLNANASYEGVWEKTDFPDVQIWIVAAAGATLFLEYSIDGGDTVHTDPSAGIALTAGVPYYDHFSTGLKHFRARVTDTSGSSNLIKLHTAYGTYTRPGQVLSNTVKETNSAILTKSLLIQEDPDNAGDYSNVTAINNKISSTSFNSRAAATLAAGATFQGVGEDVSKYGRVGVSITSDNATDGVLTMEVSHDNVTWGGPTRTWSDTRFAQPHMWNIVEKYFRIKYVNGSTEAQNLSIQTQYSNNADVLLGHQLNEVIKDETEAIIVRTGSDIRLDLARSYIQGQKTVSKFGSNPNVSASSTEDIIFTGILNFLQAATTVRVKAGNTNDTSAGTGAQQIVVEGLDENWEETSETIATAGTSASSATTTTFVRVFRAYVGNVGTYGGANTANVVIENSAGTVDLVTIEAGVGQTQTSAYTVPLGKTAYMTRVRASSSSAKASDISVWQRRNADDATTPFTGKRLVRRFLGLSGSIGFDFDSYISFPAKTDIWGSITTGSGAAGGGSLAYDLILIDT